MPHPLVTARWSELVMAAWDVPELVLRPYVPAGLELDRWQGRCFVNLVALRFAAVRFPPVPFPTLPPFAQVNLRTFVRDRDRAGVVFIRLLVSNRLVTAVSRLAYGQPATTIPITGHSSKTADEVTVEYVIRRRPRARIATTASASTTLPPAASLEHFCKERYWGFSTTANGRSREFRVEHPAWGIHAVRRWDLELDFGSLFGPTWQFLNAAPPALVTLAAGSTVHVYPPTASVPL